MAEDGDSDAVVIHAKDCLKLDYSDVKDLTTHILIGDLTKPLSLGPLKASIISLPPGTRTVPRAHSRSSVFVYVISGSGMCWHHGFPYEMAQNDCVGFRGGSGLAFAFINDAHNQDPLEFLLFSEVQHGDLIAYFAKNGVSVIEPRS